MFFTEFCFCCVLLGDAVIDLAAKGVKKVKKVQQESKDDQAEEEQEFQPVFVRVCG